MLRQLRREYAGAIYHVMNRGDRREPIFRDGADRRLFLAALTEACGKTQWQIHAYCLMRNHFHLVLETPAANLVVGMKWLLGVYTKRFNIRHKKCGHLFAGRYKALPVEGGGDGYLRTVCDYVHLNPARASRWKNFRGAATVTTCGRHGSVRPGCGWIACWGSSTFQRTAWPDGANLPG